MEDKEKLQTKQTTVRYYKDDLDKISELAGQLNTSSAEVVAAWRKAYERLQLETESSQGENLKTLRSYTDKIINLFTAMSESVDETVLNEQLKAIEAEQKYASQIVKNNEMKGDFDKQLKEMQKDLKSLTSELEKYNAYEESVEGRLQDKDSIIDAKNQQILGLTTELTDLKETLKELPEIKRRETLLNSRIEELKDELKQKDLDNQRELLNVRNELQNGFAERVQSIYDSESEKREKSRLELENRLREDHKKEIERIRNDHEKELERLRQQFTNDSELMKTEHTNQINVLEKKHSEEIKTINQNKKA